MSTDRPETSPDRPETSTDRPETSRRQASPEDPELPEPLPPVVRTPAGPPAPAYSSPAAARVPLDCSAFEPAADRLAVRREGGLVVVELSDPVRRNMMGLEMTAAWGRLMPAIAKDDQIRAVLVTGRGTAFSSGGNTAWIGADSHEPVSVLRERMLAFYRTWLAIRELDVPTIAAINGPAIGAGAALALACDMRWAGSSASMALPFLRLGMHPGLLATYLVREVGGVAVARDLLMTGRRIQASEMLAMGLVSRVVPDLELSSEALQVAQDLASAAPVATRLTKVALRDGLADGWASAMQWEGLAQGVTLATEDLAEGMAARREKRPPRFTGR
ncbi:MAG: enoyl-CoA hydratase-related protein [Candidatus Nanopelagicales bacterium]